MKRLLLVLITLLAVSPAWAHKLAPSLLRLVEDSSASYQVYWKTPEIRGFPSGLQPLFPEGCHTNRPVQSVNEHTALIQRWSLRCEESLAGMLLSVQGLAGSDTATLVKIEWADGASIQQLLNAATPSFAVPEQQSWMQVAAGFLLLGVEHIAFGLDHLLFVLALLMLMPNLRRLVWTITAFTVGHSITLSLVALGFMRYPVALVEIAIAASILVLAIELSASKGEVRWIASHSWLVAGDFGLLHGMGFAGTLQEIGLPDNDIPLALLSLNVGIELGQVAFVLVCLCAYALIRRFAAVLLIPARSVAIYTIGSLSVFWCLERAVGLV